MSRRKAGTRNNLNESFLPSVSLFPFISVGKLYLMLTDIRESVKGEDRDRVCRRHGIDENRN